jgi:DNA polymerase-1
LQKIKEVRYLQNNLFNLPSRVQPKEKTREIAQKANRKPATMPKTTSVRAKGNSAIAKKVSAIVEALKDRAKNETEVAYSTDVNVFRKYMENIRKYGYGAIDTETDSKYVRKVTKLAGLCLYVPGEVPTYFPIQHTDLQGNIIEGQLPIEVAIEEMLLSLDVNWVYHNADYDIRVLKKMLNLPRYPKVFWDTRLAGNYLNENESHQLKDLYPKYVNPEVKGEKFSTLFDNLGFNWVPYHIGFIYAARDPKYTWDLFKFQEPFLSPTSPMSKERGLYEAGKFLLEVEFPLVEVVASMEDEGVLIDEKFARELSEKYNAEKEQYVAEALEIYKTFDLSNISPQLRSKLSNPINLNSPTQLAILFYDVLGFKAPSRKKPRGTGKDELAILIERLEDGPEKDFLVLVGKIKKLEKLIGTYIDKLPAIREENGKVYGNFNQYGAKTGRFSSSDPNLQNIPSKNKEIRKMFIADPGYVFIGCDFSQQEPRVLAHLSQDEGMINAYATGLDLYCWMASEVYQVPYDECKEFRPDGSKNPEGGKRRDSVKSIVLGLLYDRGVDAIAVQIGRSVEETQKIIDMFFARFPKVKAFRENALAQVKSLGFVQTAYGVKRRLPDMMLPDYQVVDKETGNEVSREVAGYYITRYMNARWNEDKKRIEKEAEQQGLKIKDNTWKKAETERQVVNSIIQGTSANITKKSLLDLYRNEELRKLGFKLVLTVHDENIGKAPRETALKAKEIMEQVMIASCADVISVPMKCDAEIVERWYGPDITKELEGEMCA